MTYVSASTNKPPDAKGIGIAVGIHVLIVGVGLSLPGIDVPNPIPTVVSTYNVTQDPEPLTPEPEPDKPIVDIAQPSPKPTDVLPPAERALPLDAAESRYADFGREITVGDGLSDRLPIDIAPVLPDPVIVAARMDQRYSAGFQPPYPSGQLRLNAEGLVQVRVLIGTDGRVKQIALVDTPHPDFWLATRRHALKKWRFTPATRDGVPYESWIELKVLFEITD